MSSIEVPTRRYWNGTAQMRSNYATLSTMRGRIRPVAATADAQAAERQVLAKANTIILGTRHCANGLAAATSLATSHAIATPIGISLLAVVGCWAVYRLATRSPSSWLGAIDLALVMAVCASIPAITGDPHFHEFNSAPLVIAGTAVVTFTLIRPTRSSVPITLLIAASYAWGAVGVVGWENLPSVGALYYFAVQWLTATLLRRTTLRVATAVDRARTDRKAAAMNEQVSNAIRDNEREHLALLHDTAASTLLLVGQGAALPPDRLAAQARRDLAVLAAGAAHEPVSGSDLVTALRDATSLTTTPVTWNGLREVRIDETVAGAVAAAAREACNNVDRHARARRICVEVGSRCVKIVDDGVGFDPTDGVGGHGLVESIVGRMQRAGGDASVRSILGQGTVVELQWPESIATTRNPAPESIADADRLAERVRVVFGLVMVVYALVNLAFAAQYSIAGSEHTRIDAWLAVLAAAATLLAVPQIVGRSLPAAVRCLAAGALAIVSVVQPLLMDAGQLDSREQWTQSTIGWCLLPLLLALPTRTAAVLLLGYWFLPAMINLIREPSAATFLNIGLGTASILTLQLFALFFAVLMRGAATTAHREAEMYWEQQTLREVARAVRDDYRRRTESLASAVLPLLTELGNGKTIDTVLRLRARAESNRLRMLFDNAAVFSHPLLGELRPVVDAAETRGVSVTLHADVDLPDLSETDRVAFIGPIVDALRRTQSSARIVLTATGDEAVASIICDIEMGTCALASLPSTYGDRLETVLLDDRYWITVHHKLFVSPHGRELHAAS